MLLWTGGSEPRIMISQEFGTRIPDPRPDSDANRSCRRRMYSSVSSLAAAALAVDPAKSLSRSLCRDVRLGHRTGQNLQQERGNQSRSWGGVQPALRSPATMVSEISLVT